MNKISLREDEKEEEKGDPKNLTKLEQVEKLLEDIKGITRSTNSSLPEHLITPILRKKVGNILDTLEVGKDKINLISEIEEALNQI